MAPSSAFPSWEGLLQALIESVQLQIVHMKMCMLIHLSVMLCYLV